MDERGIPSSARAWASRGLVPDTPAQDINATQDSVARAYLATLEERELARRPLVLAPSTEPAVDLASDRTPLALLGLRPRTLNALTRAGIQTVAQLAALSEERLFSIYGIGVGSVADVAQALSRYAAQDPLSLPPDQTDKALMPALVQSEEPIYWLSLTTGTQYHLFKRGVRSIGDLAGMTSAEIMAIAGLGPGKLAGILAALEAFRATQMPTGVPALTNPPSQSAAPGGTSVTPLAVLGLSARCCNALIHAHVDTIEALTPLTREVLLAVRNIGVRSADEALEKVAAWRSLSGAERERRHLEWKVCNGPPMLSGSKPLPTTGGPDVLSRSRRRAFEPSPETLADLLNLWLQSLEERNREIVSLRLGLDGPPATLEDIGVRYHVTRERVRQVVATGLRKLQYGRLRGYATAYLDSVTRLADQMGGLLSTDELRSELPLAMPLGDIDPLPAAQLLCAVSGRLRWLHSEGVLVLENMPYKQIRTIRIELREIIMAHTPPVLANEVIAQSVNAHLFDPGPRADEAFLHACLRTDPCVEQQDGQVRLFRGRGNSKRARAVAALRVIGEPAHVERILAEVNAGRPDDEQVTERNLRACLSARTDTFVRVGRSIYALGEWSVARDGSVENAVYRVLAEHARSPVTR